MLTKTMFTKIREKTDWEGLTLTMPSKKIGIIKLYIAGLLSIVLLVKRFSCIFAKYNIKISGAKISKGCD